VIVPACLGPGESLPTWLTPTRTTPHAGGATGVSLCAVQQRLSANTLPVTGAVRLTNFIIGSGYLNCLLAMFLPKLLGYTIIAVHHIIPSPVQKLPQRHSTVFQ
jgi:hypothetical protein